MVQVPDAVKSLIPLVWKAGVKAAKKKLVFHQICQQLNIDNFENDFDFAYLHTLAIFLINKSPDWAILFDLPESRAIFKKCHPNSNYQEFDEHLDLQLHITIKQGELKSLDHIPDGLIDEFAGLYSELIAEHMPPVSAEVVKEIKIAGIRSDERHDEILGLLKGKTASAAKITIKSPSIKPDHKSETPKIMAWSPFVEETRVKLKGFYKNDEIKKGLELAEIFLQENLHDGINITILSYIFNFKMRWGDYPGIRRQIKKELHSYDKYPEFKALFQSKLFECELRESYDLLPDNTAFYRKLGKAKILLEDIPNRLEDDNYFYLCGRYFLERWWAYQSPNKTNLEHALARLLDIKKKRWWVECYICMVLKLLKKDVEFKLAVANHRKVMIDTWGDEPNRASVKIHLLNVLILMDDQTNELGYYLEKIKKPTSSSDLNGSLRHYIDMIYYNDEQRRDKYQKLIESWK